TITRDREVNGFSSAVAKFNEELMGLLLQVAGLHGCGAELKKGKAELVFASRKLFDDVELLHRRQQAMNRALVHAQVHGNFGNSQFAAALAEMRQNRKRLPQRLAGIAISDSRASVGFCEAHGRQRTAIHNWPPQMSDSLAVERSLRSSTDSIQNPRPVNVERLFAL